jgi:DnaK suppressor protein
MRTNSDWANLRNALLARQAELAITGNSRDEIRIEREADELDGALRAADRELALDQLTRDSRVSRDILSALARMDEGSYGVCLCCDDEISLKRLQAIPWTALCIRCQEAADRDDQGRCVDHNGNPPSRGIGASQIREAA